MRRCSSPISPARALDVRGERHVTLEAGQHVALVDPT